MRGGTDVPAVRLLPMSDRQPGFAGKSIERVQSEFFLRRLPAGGGRYRYPSSGLNAGRGAIVLFQFKARVVASAVFLHDERYERLTGGFAGVLHFDPSSVRTFEPVDAEAMRAVWPGFRAFGHVKQTLNPGQWPSFERRLKGVRTPADG